MNETMFATLKSISNTIGTHMLTIKLYEHDGNIKEAEQLKEINLKLEDQLDRMIKLFRSSNPAKD